ncbi:MAG: polyprenyl synthetase family protein [Thermodesulfobacteriota bacterium]
MDLLDSIQITYDKLQEELIQRLKSRVPVASKIGAHLMNSGGKRIRPQLTIIAARMGGYTGEDAIRLSSVIECIHTATLLHDDVVDEADTRRGRPAANTLWTNEMCVLGGDFILAKAFSTLTDLDNLRIVKIVSQTTARLSEGELLQMANIGNIDLSEDEYLQIIIDKTATLMETACRGGAILGGLSAQQEEALAQFGLNLGIAFQMTDDVIDYCSEKEVMGKNPGKDLEEGKLTIPLIIALKSAEPEERSRVEELLTKRILNREDLQWIRDFLHRRGGIPKTLEKSREYLERAKAQLDAFPDSEERRALVRLADRIQARTY